MTSPLVGPAIRTRGARKILLLEMGAFELVFVTLVLSSVFGLLNYFNILRLWSAFPAFSFLPHQTISRPHQEFAPAVLATPRADTVDLATGKVLLLAYLTDTIARSYLPDTLRSQPVIRSHDQLLLVWDDPSASESGVARLVFEQDQEHIQMERLSLQVRKPHSHFRALCECVGNTARSGLCATRVQRALELLNAAPMYGDLYPIGGAHRTQGRLEHRA